MQLDTYMVFFFFCCTRRVRCRRACGGCAPGLRRRPIFGEMDAFRGGRRRMPSPASGAGHRVGKVPVRCARAMRFVQISIGYPSKPTRDGTCPKSFPPAPFLPGITTGSCRDIAN